MLPSVNPPISFPTVAASDTTLQTGCQFIRVGVAGNLVLKGPGDTGPCTAFAVAAGEYVPFGEGYIMAASTASGFQLFK